MKSAAILRGVILPAVVGGVVLLGLAPGAAANPMPPDWTAYDATHYDLAIAVGDGTITGTGRLEGRVVQSGLDEIVLALADELAIEQVTSSTHTITAHERFADRVRIHLAAPLAADEVFSVTVSYSGTPPSVGGAVSDYPFNWRTHTYEQVATPVIFTMSVPDRAWTWWPCKPVLGDKATVAMSVTADSALTVVSNGKLLGVDEEADGGRTWRYAHGHPVASYLVSLAISEYAVLEDSVTVPFEGGEVTIPLRFYVYQEDLADARVFFARTGEMITFLSELFGLYPFADERYAVAAAPIGGGMEHQTCTTLGGHYVNRDGNHEWILIHELSHQWWGDWLGLADWKHVWLNEGFATYCEALWVEHKEGARAYTDYMRELDSYAPPEGLDFNGTVYDPVQLFGITPYRKGAWVLHMLRHIVDDDAVFFSALRTYFESLGGTGQATTEVFHEIMEAETGLELDTFFDQWIYHTGRPLYRWTWSSERVASGYQVTLDLVQEQEEPEVYVMPIDVEVGISGDPLSSRRFKIQNTAREQTFTFTVDSKPQTLAIDPDDWVLKPLAAAPPAHALLYAPRPNPTRALSRVTYMLPAAGEVSLHVLDVAGRLVRTLVDRRLQGAEHTVEWDGTTSNGDPAASGVYYLRLEAPRGAEQRALVLVR